MNHNLPQVKNNIPKISILIIAALLLVIGLSFFFYLEKTKYHKNLTLNQAELDLYKEKADFLEQKSFADELFIAGALDSSMAEYHKLFSEADEIGFFKKRSELKHQIEEEQKEAKRKELERKSEFSQLQRTLEIQLFLTEEKHKLINDSLSNNLKKQIAELSEQVEQKEAELKEIPAMQKLNFTNSKGSKIKYFGEVLNGKAFGQGVGIWNTGSVYEGEWKDNLRHGKGKYEWPDGERYEGEYVNGQRTGQGTYYWKNGDKYEGYWKEDRRNGFGVVYDEEGKVKFKGEWKNDELIQNGKANN
ncbi:MAG: hypothetical protein H0X62_07870 [Bacteroidetes bacterium]|nr:hypothetical protein [Bacteroidota bacterium]